MLRPVPIIIQGAHLHVLCLVHHMPQQIPDDIHPLSNPPLIVYPTLQSLLIKSSSA